MMNMKACRFGIGVCFLVVLLVLTGCEVTINPIKTYHTLFFDGNGQTQGEVPNFGITQLVETQVTVPDNSGNMIKAGYLFGGWNTKTDGTGYTFQAGDTLIMPAANLTLYALWLRIYLIGDSGPAGGIIFYDKGTYSDGWRYLESAPVSTEWTDRIWGERFAADVQGTLDTIGTGKANTQAIVDLFGIANGGDYAARLCANLEHDAYDDWFLPSIDELDEMYTNLYQESLGGFSDDYYWSSTADTENANVAKLIYFASHSVSTGSTYHQRRVRAVRSF